MEMYSLGETIVKMENVSLTIDNNLILKDINLEVKDIIRPGMQQGQVISILAPSGMGKSQLFKILAGLTPCGVDKQSKTHVTGSAKIGFPLEDVQVGKVGVVQQNYPLFDWKTVIGNLKLAGKHILQPSEKETFSQKCVRCLKNIFLGGSLTEEVKTRIELYLNHFGLADKQKHYPAQLSGGQRQRVAIAQQLVRAEHFLLLDEPFSGLDVTAINRVSEMIVQISQLHEYNTIFIVSHDIESTMAISDQVWLLGKDRDINGKFVAGATIKKRYDLAQMGMAWDKNIRNNPRFNALVKEITEVEFPNLG